ncbi:unnamed protein product, partial [Rangifer tarandus platyrhynchus]
RDRQYFELCGKMENLLRCSRCRSSFYCSKEHQRQDWKKHKLVCQVGEKVSAPGTGQPLSRAARPPGEGLSHGGLRPKGQTKPMPALKLALECIVPCMNKHGICVVDGFLGKETGQQIGDKVRALHDTGKFTDGQLVSQKSDSSKDIRGDKITWIEGEEPCCETIGLLMNNMDDLIRHCNGKLGNYKINGRTKAM